MDKHNNPAIETEGGESAEATATIEPTSFVDYKKFRRDGELPPETTEEKQAETDEGNSEAAAETQAESSGEADPPENAEDGDKKGKRRKPTAERRIQELTRKQREAEARADTAEQQLKALQGGKPEGPAPTTTPAADLSAPPARPKLEDYEEYEAYEAALEGWQEAKLDWKLDQRLAAKAAEDRAAEQTQTLAANWATQSDSARVKHEDFDEVLGANTTELPEHVTQALLESENGAEVAYHLASPDHTEELEALLTKRPIDAIKAIGVLEARLTTPPTTNRQKASKAPAPPVPVGGGKGAASLETAGSFAQYKELRRQQQKAG